MSETNTTDSNTYHEVNINRYSELQYGGARLYTNGNGDVLLTPSYVTAEQINSGANPPVYYDMNRLVIEKNEETGTQTYSVRDISDDGRGGFTLGDRGGVNNYDPFGRPGDRVETLLAVENELKSALIDDYKRRLKTDPNAKPPNILNLKPQIIPGGDSDPQEASIKELEELINSNYRGLHSSDRFLQRLSLKNLKYPLDADYGNTQDYIQIDQFTYQAPNPEILFGGEDTIKTFGNILKTGLNRESPKERTVGLVKLPMPNDLKDSNNVAWGEDQLNAITAAAATLSAGGVSAGFDILESIASGDQALLQGLSQALTGTLGGLKDALVEAKRVAFKGGGTGNDLQLLGRSAVGSGLLNLAGFGVSPEAILARGAGVIPNSNLQLLFNAPTLRAFRFNWKMSPRSQEEAIRINNIIRFFKQGMAVKKNKNSGPGGGSYFLATPNVFDITFRTSKTNLEITNENNAVLRIKTCACVGAAVNYTPQQMWNAYEKGQPTSCILSLEFKELEPVYNTDYEEDPFAYDDLTGFVPENAIGY